MNLSSNPLLRRRLSRCLVTDAQSVGRVGTNLTNLSQSCRDSGLVSYHPVMTISRRHQSNHYCRPSSSPPLIGWSPQAGPMRGLMRPVSVIAREMSSPTRRMSTKCLMFDYNCQSSVIISTTLNARPSSQEKQSPQTKEIIIHSCHTKVTNPI